MNTRYVLALTAFLLSVSCTPQEAFEARLHDASRELDSGMDLPQASDPSVPPSATAMPPGPATTGTISDLPAAGSSSPASSVIDTPSECAPGERRCTALSVQVCDSNANWADEEICAPGTECLVATLSCGDCVDGEVQCQDRGNRAVCLDGRFVGEPCPSTTPFCDAGQCVECTLESLPTCQNNAPVKCMGGSWEASTACSADTPLCDPNVGECVECAQDATECTSEGHSAICNASGHWDVVPCGNDRPVCVSGECRACDPTSDVRRCQNNGVEQCNEMGSWALLEACSETSTVCLESIGACGACNAGETQCNDSSSGLSVCNDSGVFVDELCPESKPVCSGAECVECSQSAGLGFACAGNTPLVCASNTWVVQAPCSGETPVCSPDSGECVCANGTHRCEGNVLQECTEGAWDTLDTCSGEYPVCDDDAGKCSCTEGSAKCVVGTEDSRLVCEGGVWVEELCRDEAPVCHDGECSECVPGTPPECAEPTLGQTYYTGGQLKLYCSAAATTEEEACNHVCSAGDCVDTRKTAGSYTCDVHYGIVCTSPQVCCAAVVPQCVDSADECGNIHPMSTAKAVRVTCDDRSDCHAGQVCCYHHKASNGAIPLIQCEEPEDCSNLDGAMGVYDRVICGPTDPCSEGTCTVFGQRGISECEP